MSATRGADRRIRELVDDLDEDARESVLEVEVERKLDAIGSLLTRLEACFNR